MTTGSAIFLTPEACGLDSGLPVLPEQNSDVNICPVAFVSPLNMNSVPALAPTTCYICEQAARIEPGRNSYLVDCGHCQVRYEIDLTAWTTPVPHRLGVLAWIREQQVKGHEWPVVTKEKLEQEGREDGNDAGKSAAAR